MSELLSGICDLERKNSTNHCVHKIQIFKLPSLETKGWYLQNYEHWFLEKINDPLAMSSLSHSRALHVNRDFKPSLGVDRPLHDVSLLNQRYDTTQP